MNTLTDKQKELLLSNKEDLKAIVIAFFKTPPLSFNATDEEDFDSFASQFERKPILTTLDGVIVYKHFQFVYSLDTKDYATKWKLTAGDFLKDYGLLDYVICFSTEEIREEYILLNSPKLSVNEVMDIWGYGITADTTKQKLIQLVKSKQ